MLLYALKLHFIVPTLPSGRKEKKPLLGSHFSCQKSPSAALIFRAAIILRFIRFGGS